MYPLKEPLISIVGIVLLVIIIILISIWIKKKGRDELMFCEIKELSVVVRILVATIVGGSIGLEGHNLYMIH